MGLFGKKKSESSDAAAAAASSSSGGASAASSEVSGPGLMDRLEAKSPPLQATHSTPPTIDDFVQATTDARPSDSILAFTILGASGDLAKKKIYPVLWSLYTHKLIDRNSIFLGYARSEMSHEDLIKKIRPHLKAKTDSEKSLLEEFLGKCEYVKGAYDEADAFVNLDKELSERTSKHGKQCTNRVFYLALPPSVFEPVTTNLKQHCMSKCGWTRVIVEKPFGKDSESFGKLRDHLAGLFKEDQVYRIDHYLGKEMVQNMLILRFGNRFLGPIWNRENIQSVLITMKEPFGTQGRGGYFDEFGIIRDVMQNHLLQILTLVGMERPVSSNGDDIRDEKVKCLKAIHPLEPADVVLGQYVASNLPNNEESKQGYLDDETVPRGSKTPTFATAVLRIRNDRWDGVPFIIKCGKALNEKKTEVRIQFRPIAGELFADAVPNELVIRVQPDEAVYMKVMCKKPGMSFEMEQTDLDLTYEHRFHSLALPDAYERLILDVVRGEKLHFVRTDELEEAWRIFSPLLKKIDEGAIEPIEYPFGSRGPQESDDFIVKCGYKYNKYQWTENRK